MLLPRVHHGCLHQRGANQKLVVNAVQLHAIGIVKVIKQGAHDSGTALLNVAAQVEVAANTKMVHVVYKEISQLYVAVSTGEVDWAIGSLASAGPLLKSGRLRLLAVGDTVRSGLMPNVPTIEESGGPKGISIRSWVAVMAPRGTPPPVVAVLNKSLNDALALPEMVEKFGGFGFVPYPLTPVALNALIDNDTVLYAEIVKRTGASAD